MICVVLNELRECDLNLCDLDILRPLLLPAASLGKGPADVGHSAGKWFISENLVWLAWMVLSMATVVFPCGSCQPPYQTCMFLKTCKV